jgi:hypothetical protein
MVSRVSILRCTRLLSLPRLNIEMTSMQLATSSLSLLAHPIRNRGTCPVPKLKKAVVGDAAQAVLVADEVVVEAAVVAVAVDEAAVVGLVVVVAQKLTRLMPPVLRG